MIKQCLACGKILGVNRHKFCNRECYLLYLRQQHFIMIEKNKDVCFCCKEKGLPNISRISEMYFICRKCWNNKRKHYYKTVHGKKVIYNAIRKSHLKFPEKHRARVKLNYAVKKGKIYKPKKCEVCKEIKKLHGHHHDYNKPLEVKWVCTGCHADIHNEKQNT